MSFQRFIPRSKQYHGDRAGIPGLPYSPSLSSQGVCTPDPKEAVKAKPGKRKPTAVEAKWMDAIVAYGCVACRHDGNGIVTPHVHHILRGGRRIGHLFTLPLCPSHHQDDGRPGYVARHPWKKRFEQRYGSEMHLLGELKVLLAGFGAWRAE